MLKHYFFVTSLLGIALHPQIAHSADIILEKAITVSGPYSVGQTITYNISVVNAGPGTATNIVLTDTPTNMTITSVNSNNCSALPCTIPSLGNGSVEHISITATIDASGVFDNSATAIADQTDPNPSNNTDNTNNGGVAIGAQKVPALSSLALLLLILSFFLGICRQRLSPSKQDK